MVGRRLLRMSTMNSMYRQMDWMLTENHLTERGAFIRLTL